MAFSLGSKNSPCVQCKRATLRLGKIFEQRKGQIMKRQWYYRGSLKSCNYSCSYCPFSKRKGSVTEKDKDKKALFQFVEAVEQSAQVEGAVQIVPYGEALIHEYYWEALAKLSQNSRIDAVGAQSNFSFPVEKMLSVYCDKGGVIDKLRLWGTFHPEMTDVDRFVKQCMLLLDAKVKFCVGVVGVSEHLPMITEIRNALPQNVYVWINKMDGLRRPYTKEEIEAFLEIDEYFGTELTHFKADVSLCGENRFVEADGTMRRCNICRQTVGNFYEAYSVKSENVSVKKIHMDSKIVSQKKEIEYGIAEREVETGTKCKLDEYETQTKTEYSKEQCAISYNKIKDLCTRRECSCFLSYCNRNEEQLLFFQPYPAFRIPTYPKAIFFDIDGTLIPEGQKKIPEQYRKGLSKFVNDGKIYLATSLPYEIAKQRTREIWNMVAGGVFANGSRCVIKECDNQNTVWDEIAPMNIAWLEQAKQKSKQYGYRVHQYKKGQEIYKITLAFHKGRQQELEDSDFIKGLAEDLQVSEECQFLQEENCIQLTKKGTGKLEGVLRICERMGYKKQEVMVVGNSENDIPMLTYFPFSVAAKGSSEKVKKCAWKFF